MAAAYASLVSLMQLIHDLQHHPSPPISLDKQLLDSITQRITYFQEFLHDYNSSPPSPVAADGDDEDEAADPLEMHIAASAYAAEDAIESHIVDCANQQESNENANDEKIKSINRCCGILQCVIEEMDSIKKVVVGSEKLKNELVIHDQVDTTSVLASVARNITILGSDDVLASVARNETMVGSDDVLLEIMEKLVGGQLDCQIIPIVGMGGIGKTFLAKTIYNKTFIKDRFDICAWATISQHYDTRQILCELLSQATKREKARMSGKRVDELGLELHKYLLFRRFLIVMDDMWSMDAWNEIQCYFPDKKNGSRVLVTTRLTQLISQLNNNDYNLRMSFLDKSRSWELFSKTVFGEKSCPPELEKIGEKIVDNCRGLPLSIVVVGGLLKNMDATRASWESIRDNFTSVVNMDNNKHCLRLLKLSYNHLPVYLKPCFLYMGVFEEDEEIRVSTLFKLWMSEGFLKPINGEALETTARGFLQDLVDRNLILIGELGCRGSIKSCKMHDLVRDMCLKEVQKEGFYHVIGKCNPPPQGMNAQRRVVIPKYTSKENVRGDLRFMLHTRSLLCERGDVALCWDMILLRTLQTNKKSTISDREIDLNSLVFRFVNLRHLSIRAPEMSSFLPYVSRLWNLHTLIVFYSSLSKPILFADFWKMPQLRHVEFAFGIVHLPDPPNGNGRDGDPVMIMENLHTLKGVGNLKCSEAVVKRIPNIKRLKLEYNGYGGDDVYFSSNMKNLCGLEFLSINFYTSLSSITPMQKITFPHSLKKLSLWMGSDFKWDDMLEKIGSLPLLEKLKLELGCFGRGEWEIAEEQFPCLKYLKLCDCRGLENWMASEEDSYILPRLEHLHLVGLEELKSIPFELGNIVTLRTIKLIDCGEGSVKSAKEMFDEQVELEGGEDQLSFHVAVNVREKQQHLMSLAGPNFYVNL